jgi:acyl-CoA hydrolase
MAHSLCHFMADQVCVLPPVCHSVSPISRHQVTTKELAPTFATANPALMGTNVLHDIDRAAQVCVVCWGVGRAVLLQASHAVFKVHSN